MTAPKFLSIKNIALFLTFIFANFSIASAHNNIGVVNIDDIVQNSQAAQDAQKKLAKKQKKFQAEINKKQKTLEAEGKKIAAKKNVLSKDAFIKEQEKFQAKVTKLTEFASNKQNELKKSSLRANETILKHLEKAIEEVRKEQDLDLVISGGATVFRKDSLNISPAVLKKLDAKISKVKIK